MLKHSWKSRKVLIGLPLLVALVIIPTVAMFMGYADFDQWAGFVQITVISLFGALAAGMAHDNHLEAKGREKEQASDA